MPAMVGLPASLCFKQCHLDHLLTCETVCDQVGHLCIFAPRNSSWWRTVLRSSFGGPLRDTRKRLCGYCAPRGGPGRSFFLL
jgi:hypothetical protein